MKIQTTITDGKLPKAYSDIIRQELLRLNGKVVSVQIKEIREAKKNYLGYWRGIILPKLLDYYAECGDPKHPDKLSAELVLEIGGLYERYIKTNGEVELQPKSTSDLEPEEWLQLFNAVKAWAPPEINFEQ